MVDIVIVGAGAAGISAGRVCAARGLSFVILEASDRIGGRAYTDTASLPGYWDQGAQWFHCADINPLVAQAKTLNWAFERTDRTDQALHFLHGRWHDTNANAAFNTHLAAAFDAIYAASAAGRDVPVSEVIPDGGPWHPEVRNILQLMISADPEATSALGYGDYDDTQVNWIVTGGLGALIARLGAGLPISTGCAVRAIAAIGKGVQIDTDQGSLVAQAVIVTASTNLLLSGAIRFAPGPAQGVLDLMPNLPCGSYEKVALAFDRLPFDATDALFCNITLQDAARPLGFQIVGPPQPKLIAHFGGSAARDLAAMGPDGMIAYARDAVTAAFGNAASKTITGAAVTAWQANPWVQGAYSYSVPGAGTARTAMINANAGPIRFAGEAFAARAYSTVHGAWQSGRMIATELADAISSGKRPA